VYRNGTGCVRFLGRTTGLLAARLGMLLRVKAFLGLLVVAALILVGGWFFGWLITSSRSKQGPVGASLGGTENEKFQDQRGNSPQTEKWSYHMDAGTNLRQASPQTAEVDQYGDPITVRLAATNTGGGTGPGWRLLNGYTPATNNWTSFNLAGTNETNETWFGNAFSGANER
jgi:hypothetical protein